MSWTRSVTMQLAPRSLGLAGDFNMEPSSVIHEFCTSGAISTMKYAEAVPSNPQVENIVPHGILDDFRLPTAYISCLGGAGLDVILLVLHAMGGSCF